MIFTFYKARGMSVGSSLVEEDKLDLAKELEAAAKEKGVEFILPTDVIIADKFDAEANTKTVSADAIPDGWMVRADLPLAHLLHFVVHIVEQYRLSLGSLCSTNHVCQDACAW